MGNISMVFPNGFTASPHRPARVGVGTRFGEKVTAFQTWSPVQVGRRDAFDRPLGWTRRATQRSRVPINDWNEAHLLAPRAGAVTKEVQVLMG